MSFLRCTPSVFVIGNEYEILILTERCGRICVTVGNETFYEPNSGVLPSERLVAKIRLPQATLDREAAYTIRFCATVERRAYGSVFAEEETRTFSFAPLRKTEDIHVYHIADVHYRFELAKKTASYFGDALDLLIVNGDIGEVETEENYFEVCRLIGEIAGGRVPVLFARGNHDTRGRLAERFTDYFPNQALRTYYTFELGPLAGVVLDCGEDKDDSHPEYGGANAFAPFRREESTFLHGITPVPDKIPFAVCHICPVQTTARAGSKFDIERDVYATWNTELERLGIRFMLCGHIHHAYMLFPDDDAALLPHNYPVIVGSACSPDDLWGTALTIHPHGATVCFTDSGHNVREKYELTF